MKKNIIKTFAFMFSAMFLAKILGLVRNIVFANFYGTGFEATAFFTASRIPLQLLDLTLGAAISSTFIPVFNEYMQKNGKERAIHFASNFLNVIIIISLVLSILGMIFAAPIVKFISPNLDPTTMELTVSLARILFPVLLFTAVAYVFVGFLQSMEEFNIPAIISVVSNGLLILYLLIFNDKFGVQGVAVAMLIGWGTQIIVQLPAALKKGFKYQLKVDFKEEGLKKVVKLAIPILISSWVQPINNIVNLRLASGLEGGQAVSAIEYAYTLYLIIVGVFSYTLSNIIFPSLSKLSASNDEKQFKDIIKRAISISIFFIIPMSVGIGLLSKDIISLIYERGEFTVSSTNYTAAALQFYAIGMIGYGLMEVLNKTFYARQDAKTPMFISGFAIILNICLSIFLVKIMGYTGLPLAASITSILTTVIMLVIINKKINGIVDKETLKETIKTIISAMAMGVIVYFVKTIDLPLIISLAVAVILGIVIYLIVEIFLKSDIIKVGLEMLKSKINKNNER
ncbi:MAG: murein biosynthesis integral membrane protein MurJ [Clostridia bacterium]|nr:murein biosynthesis integral membrane protein MurJ [Clostridia bacterium]